MLKEKRLVGPESVAHMQNAILAKKIVRQELSKDDSCSPSLSLKIAAHLCMESSPSMTVSAFKEGVEDSGKWPLSIATAHSCWYAAKKEFLA